MARQKNKAWLARSGSIEEANDGQRSRSRAQFGTDVGVGTRDQRMPSVLEGDGAQQALTKVSVLLQGTWRDHPRERRLDGQTKTRQMKQPPSLEGLPL